MKLRSHHNVRAIGIALMLLSELVQSADPRSLKTSNPIQITDQDFDFQTNEAELSSPSVHRQFQWEYNLNLQEIEGVSYEEYGEDAWEYLLSLHFGSFALDPRCTMEIRDKHDNLVSELAGMGSFWSEHITGLSSKLLLTCKTQIIGEEKSHPFQSTIVLDEYAVIDRNRIHGSRERRRMEKRDLLICRDNDLLNARCFEATHPAAFAVSDAVVHMTYADVDFCTGWMVSPGLLITAAHCVLTEEEVLNTVYQFNYISDNCDSDVFSNAEIYKAVKLETVDFSADYAIIRMERDPGFKYGYLSMENRLPSVGESVYIPQHPAGRDLELGIFERHPAVPTGLCTVKTNGQASGDNTCDLYGATFKDFINFCDTEGGSSGAPVISVNTNLVVGIHHCGSSCENFAVPITAIYSAVNSLVMTDITTAIRPLPTDTPSAFPSMSPTILAPVSSGGGSRRSVPNSLEWTFGICLMVMLGFMIASI